VADDLEKTEEATPKKIEDARKEGNVPKSMDVTGFVGLVVGMMALLALGGFILNALMEQFHYTYSFFKTPLEPRTLESIVIASLENMAFMVLPLALILVVAGVLGNIGQFGIIFTTKPLIPDLKKIDPIKGAKNLFSLQKLMEGAKITAKVIVAFSVGAYVFLQFIQELPEVERFDVIDQLEWLLDKAIMIALIMLIVFFLFSAIDLMIVRYNYFKKLRMSKQEIKDEFKTTEGNPEVKARIRRLQHEMSRNRMMQDVPEADVVITNPTHFAIALKYDQESSAAPIVLAKGADLVAQRIKEIAREHNIQIYEDKKLAQALYKQVDVGGEIPRELYGAVAEVLAFVYRAKNS